jgi:hypothetical protein
MLSKVNIQEEMAKPDKTTTQLQGLAYLTRARARARGQDSVKSLMTQAGYSLKNATSFRLLALVCMFCHPKSA